MTDERAESVGIDPQRLQEIRERMAKATPGPWTIAPCSDADEIRNVVSQYETVPGGARANWIAELDASLDFDSDREAELGRLQADTEFIAHAREDVPYLLALVDAQQREGDDAVREAQTLRTRLLDTEIAWGKAEAQLRTITETLRQMVAGFRASAAVSFAPASTILHNCADVLEQVALGGSATPPPPSEG